MQEKCNSRERWTDSHNHLAMEEFEGDRKAVVERAGAEGVFRMVIVGTNAADWSACGALSAAFGFACTAGLHPHEASKWNRKLCATLERTLKTEGAIAVGEIGLDYHYDLSPRKEQLRAFEEQCSLAVEHDLPVIVHSREAFEETLAVLASIGPALKGVIHCFTYGPREAEAFLALGCHLSFSGIATFPNAPSVREAAALTPINRVLVETDAPYLAPVPYRGKRCEPFHVAVVGRYIADFLGIDREEMAETTTANAAALFGWPLA